MHSLNISLAYIQYFTHKSLSKNNFIYPQDIADQSPFNAFIHLFNRYEPFAKIL